MSSASVPDRRRLPLLPQGQLRVHGRTYVVVTTSVFRVVSALLGVVCCCPSTRSIGIAYTHTHTQIHNTRTRTRDRKHKTGFLPWAINGQLRTLFGGIGLCSNKTTANTFQDARCCSAFREPGGECQRHLSGLWIPWVLLLHANADSRKSADFVPH